MRRVKLPNMTAHQLVERFIAIALDQDHAMFMDDNAKFTRLADAVIDEWLRSGRDPDVGGVWFALPHIYEAKRTE